MAEDDDRRTVNSQFDIQIAAVEGTSVVHSLRSISTRRNILVSSGGVAASAEVVDDLVASFMQEFSHVHAARVARDKLLVDDHARHGGIGHCPMLQGGDHGHSRQIDVLVHEGVWVVVGQGIVVRPVVAFLHTDNGQVAVTAKCGVSDVGGDALQAKDGSAFVVPAEVTGRQAVSMTIVIALIDIEVVEIGPPFRYAVAIDVIDAEELLGSVLDALDSVREAFKHVVFFAEVCEVVNLGAAVVEAVVRLERIRIPHRCDVDDWQCRSPERRGHDTVSPVLDLPVGAWSIPEAELVHQHVGGWIELSRRLCAKVNVVDCREGADDGKLVTIEYQIVLIRSPDQGDVRPGILLQRRCGLSATHEDESFARIHIVDFAAWRAFLQTETVTVVGILALDIEDPGGRAADVISRLQPHLDGEAARDKRVVAVDDLCADREAVAVWQFVAV